MTAGERMEIRTQTEFGAVFTLGDTLFSIESVSERIFRVVTTKETKITGHSLFISRRTCCPSAAAVTKSTAGFRVAAGQLEAEISENGTIVFRRSDGKQLLTMPAAELERIPVVHYDTEGQPPVIVREKTVDGERNFIQNLKPHEDRTAWRAKLNFLFASGEHLYGLGQGEEGILDYRGQTQYLYQHNMRTPMPVLMSSAGYAILLNCGSIMTFQDNACGSYFFLDTVSQAEFYFILGPSADQMVSGLRMLTGRAAMLPRWAFGYVQSKERYRTATELVQVAEHYRELALPLDCVVQDWNTWTPGRWGEKRVDPERFGDLPQALQKLHQLHVHAMVSVWPNMNRGTEDHTEFEREGLLLNDLCTYDAFSPRARAVYWRQARRELWRDGFDAWWCDSTEPFSGPDWKGEIKKEPWERYCLVGGEHKHFLDPEQANLYAYMHAKGIYENQRAETGNKRVLNLSRSGYAGAQKYGVVLWSGDTDAKWETLRKQITEGLSMGLSGYPYWTLDIGAFFTVGKDWRHRGCGCEKDPTPKWFWQGEYDQGANDPAYRELYTRWFEFGCFLPMFRSHGTDTPREIWNFGKKGEMFYDALAKFLHLRYRLMPYIYSLAGSVVLDNDTMLRSMFFDFPQDEKALTIRDAFLFGPALYICPVLKPMYFDHGGAMQNTVKIRECYLPAGGWFDFWTGSPYEGGRTVCAAAPIDRIPIFIRAGSILPMQEGLLYADQKTDEPMKLTIYPGADGAFTLYEDEGDGYGYENGAFSRIRLFWTEKTSTLTIGAREGRYPGMPEKREFLVCCGEQERQISYSGEQVSLRLPPEGV